MRFTRSQNTDSLSNPDISFDLYADGRIIATVYRVKTGELMPQFRKNTPGEWKLFAQWCAYHPSGLGPLSRTPVR